MPRHLKFILLLGFITNPRWHWQNRDWWPGREKWNAEWRRATW